jgi:hypothetical protein
MEEFMEKALLEWRNSYPQSRRPSSAPAPWQNMAVAPAGTSSSGMLVKGESSEHHAYKACAAPKSLPAAVQMDWHNNFLEGSTTTETESQPASRIAPGVL